MKLILNSFLIFFLLICSPVFGESFYKTYNIKSSGIKIGTLDWEVSINNKHYKNNLKLKSEGFLSIFYNFQGQYSSVGSVENKKLKPKTYTHIWNTNKVTKKMSLVFYSDITIIGTHTFRHARGYNNFVQANKPLGSNLGSDCIENKLGITYLASGKFLTIFNFGQLKIGENSITESPYIPYTDYTIVPFPSGNYQRVIFLSQRFQYLFNSIYNLTFEIRHENKSYIGNDKNYSSFLFFGDLSISFNGL